MHVLMHVPMMTEKSVKKARGCTYNGDSNRHDKVILRRRARRVDRQAVKNGDYYTWTPGQDKYDVA